MTFHAEMKTKQREERREGFERESLAAFVSKLTQKTESHDGSWERRNFECPRKILLSHCTNIFLRNI